MEIKIADLNKFYETQSEKVDCLFNKLAQHLLDEKRACHVKLQESRNETIECYTKPLQDIKQVIVETKNMKQDIGTNFEQIIKTIKLDAFRDIMK